MIEVPSAAASQEYPEFTQSHSDTIKLCPICEFSSRDKHEYHRHVSRHPKCDTGQKLFEDQDSLESHMGMHETVKCDKCGVNVPKSNIEAHKENHGVTESYRKGLSETPTKCKKIVPKPQKLNSFILIC